VSERILPVTGFEVCFFVPFLPSSMGVHLYQGRTE
jgi:hypothetical protein